MSLSSTAGQEIDDHMHNQIQLKVNKDVSEQQHEQHWDNWGTQEDVRHMQSLEQRGKKKTAPQWWR